MLAVVGSAVNQDGASNGLTAPNGPSQQRGGAGGVGQCRLSAAEVDVVEGHDRDQLGIRLVLRRWPLMGKIRSRENLWLGSVKSKGHTQAARGR